MEENRKLVQEQSLLVFEQNKQDGTDDTLMLIAKQLIRDHPKKTVNELLKIGLELEIYEKNERNMIAPYATNLCKEGAVVRPTKRICTASKRPKLMFTHEIAPDSWRSHIKHMKGTGPYVKHRMEIPSSKDTNIQHTVVWWTDGSVSCTCHELYNRPSDLRCHHALGMIQAVTGKTPKEIALEKEIEGLKIEVETQKKNYDELHRIYTKLIRSF